MPQFISLEAGEVALGRGIAARRAREPYVEALRASDAGRIELERGEQPATVKRLLRDSARQLGVRVRSAWEDPSNPRVLYWKKLGTR